jgi:riboflavin kinase/FMN adenylyltransferase
VKIHYELDSISSLKHTAVTTGTFDGVHLGHKTIIERLIAAAKNIDGESVLLTFYPHPRMVLFPDDNQIKMLNTALEKEQLLQACGIDHLVVIPFTKEFSRLSSLEFVRNILSNTLKAKKLVIGYDHHFGRNREGSFAHLLEFGSLYGFEVEEIPAQDIDHVAISSSKIRQALESGDLQTANSYLGYEYNITGKVIKGKQLGRTIGYPTANIEINDRYKLIPEMGVYAVKVKYGTHIFDGMLSIGKNPTVTQNGPVTIEVNIFDFNHEIYHKEITVYFHKKLRNEEKYNSVDELIAQLAIDKENTIKHFI